MHKTKRLLAIEKILSEERVSTQSALIKKLKAKGILCTQATLSRNLRQLGVSRVPDGSGGYRYSLSETSKMNDKPDVKMNILPVIRDVIEAKGMVIIHTIPGNANSTAYHIDAIGRYEIAATLAGDDTILVIPRDGISIKQVYECLEFIFPGLRKKALM